MGGHGGLNILPQKRWNPYRQDNRDKVAHDEREDRIRREQQAHRERKKRVGERISELNARLDGASGDRSNNRARSRSPASTRSVAEAAERTASAPVVAGHINLFAEAEVRSTQSKEEHAKYLRSIHHDPERRSEFDVVAESQRTPWYLDPARSLMPELKVDYARRSDGRSKNKRRGR